MRRFGSINNLQEFMKIYKDSRKIHCCGAVIFYLKDQENKMAVVASKKIGKAVKRNLAKRLLREIFYKIQNNLNNGKYILVAKKELFTLSFFDFEKKIKNCLNKLKCLKSLY